MINNEQDRLVSFMLDTMEWGTDGEFQEIFDKFQKSLDESQSINEVNPMGRTLLHTVAFVGVDDIRKSEEIARIRFLLKAGCDPNIPDEDLVTPICRVVQGEDLAFLKLLIEFGANPCLKDVNGESAIVWATHITPIDSTFFGTLLEGVKRFSPDELPNADWLEDVVNQMVEPCANPGEQAELVRVIREHYPDFHPAYKEE